MAENSDHESRVGRAIERWQDRYRLRMYPELRGLSREDATTALQIAADHRFRVGLASMATPWGLTIAAVFAIGFLIFIANLSFEDLLAQWGLSGQRVAIPLILINVLFLPWAHRKHLRKQLRRYINEELDYGDLRLCSECAYDLRASYGDNCPECGEAIPEATQRWIRHLRNQRDRVNESIPPPSSDTPR